MNIFKYFKSNKKSEENIEFTSREYLARFERIKKIIGQDEQIKANIENAFRHEYLGDMLSNKILCLGSGEMHTIYSISDKEISDNNNSISLALRLKKNNLTPYNLRSERRIEELIYETSSFYKAFIEGKNPPYFTGLVQLTDLKNPKGAIGIITEDLTKRKALKSQTIRDVFDEYIEVTDSKGKKNKFFIDRTLPNEYVSEAEALLSKLIKI